jgi:hypothetical protein
MKLTLPRGTDIETRLYTINALNLLIKLTLYLNFAFRYGKIKERFLEAYGVQPSFYARAPGRTRSILARFDLIWSSGFK